MGVNKPYKRTYRQLINGEQGADYLEHLKYAKSPRHYIRAFLLLQNDLHRIFEYVEPADNNLDCYSFRIHELLLRTCIEVEANCKAILRENGYIKKDKKGEIKEETNWSMDDYKKIEKSHRLSSYKVELPEWQGDKNVRQPFAAWSTNSKLSWYEAYNLTKHDRYINFEKANFDHLTNAMSGLIALLSAQFWTHDYSNYFASAEVLELEGPPLKEMQYAIGDYFGIKFPDDWPEEERYDFDWKKLENEEDPFQPFPYS